MLGRSEASDSHQVYAAPVARENGHGQVDGGASQLDDSARLSFSKNIAPYVYSRQEQPATAAVAEASERGYLAEGSNNYNSLKANLGWNWTANFDRGRGRSLASVRPL